MHPKSAPSPVGLPLLRMVAPIFPVITLLPWGCGGSGGVAGTPGAGNSENGIVIDVTATDLGSGQMEIRFTVQTPGSKDVGVDVDFSENRGSSYAPATLASTPAAGILPTSPDGIRHGVIWIAGDDLEDLPQHDLRVRVTPYDLVTREEGVPGESGIFGLGVNGTPQITAIITPSGYQGGWISLDYTVSDADGDYVEIQGEYSLDGGQTYGTATLGRGDGTTVSATPGGATRTIQWSAQGDAPGQVLNQVRVRLRAVDTSAGPFAESSDMTIDTRPPTLNLLTINALTREMNGSIPFTNTAGNLQSFTLLAPEQNFVIWISFLSGGQEIDSQGLVVVSDQSLGGGSAAGGIDGGEDFGDLFLLDTLTGVAALTVESDLKFSAGLHTITASISDVLGNISDPVSYTFRTGPATAEQRPFDEPDRWHLDFSRDNNTITSSTDANGVVTLSSTAVPNGVPDFVEDLRILGLQSASPPQPAVDAGLNDLVLEMVQESVLGRLNELYQISFDGTADSDSVRIEFSLTAPAAPYSRIGIGGDDPVPGYTIGRAMYDYKNYFSNNDSSPDLGIFTTNLIDYYINTSYTFRSRFNPFIPGRGTALGFGDVDVTILGSNFDRDDPGNTSQENDRYDDLALAIDGIARATAVILAHEIGHSVGLVANGPPPTGLFGGEYRASFAGPYTNSYHLDTNNNSIMASALSFLDSITTGINGPAFNLLNLAYLRERILLE